MKFENLKRKIVNVNWYQQGAAVKPLYISYPWYTCSLMKIRGKRIPVKYELIASIKNDFMDDYLSKRSLERVGRYYYSRQRKDSKFIFKLIDNWHKKFVSPYLKINRKILNVNLSQYTNSKLLGLFKKFTDIYRAVWHEAIFLDSFDLIGEKILEESIEEEGKDIRKEDLETLLSPPLPSFLQKERLEILKLAEKMIRETISQDDVNNYLGKVSTNYYWLKNDFAQTHFLKFDHFRRKAQELLRSKRRLLEEKEMRNMLDSLENKKKKREKKYKLSKDFINVLNFLAILGNFRDARKSYNQMAGNTLRKFAEEFGRRAGLEVNTVEHMFHWEFKDIFELSKKRISEIESRPKGWLYFITGPDKFEVVKGKKAARLNVYLKEQVSKYAQLKGMPAYAGVAEGEVKIIRDQNDFSKMKKGNILVASNTRPEFLPVIKMAGAVVTEEGGMTCHAAIVSRELKIPCVVGVQGITDVLKDGDKIEVDAEKGIINKLSGK